MAMMHESPSHWNTWNSAVPILSKIKLVPNLQSQSGQLFLRRELETPAWEVTYQIGLDVSDALQNLKLNEMVDLFACFYLISSPAVRSGPHNAGKSFGFREFWSGMGVFVY